jgi:hypothetical protein
MAACPTVSAPPTRLWRRPIEVSQRRIEANRRNAARSTGPRTPKGKARVARNAVKHGFWAAPVRLTPQQERDFAATYEALRDDLRPAGIGEESCVWTIAHSYAQMAAVFRYEAEAALEHHQRGERELEARIASAKPAEAARLRKHRERLRKAGLWGPTLPGPRAVNGIVRCMGSINGSLRRATADLRGLQHFRSGGRARSSKLRKQTHLVEQNRAFSLLDIATRAHRDLIAAARAAGTSREPLAQPRGTSNSSSTITETAKTNPLNPAFTGNRHARRRAAALARRRG